MSMTPEREIRVNLLDGSEVIMNTGDRVLFQASRPGAIPLSVEAELIVDDLLAALEEAQQQIKELQEGNRSACESRDMAYRSRDEAIVTSNQHYKQAFFLNEGLAEAQQTIARQREILKFYATQGNYNWHKIMSYEECESSEIHRDRGKLARTILEEGETQP
ncbi:hypothetical protein [Paenibacillus graminis]|uniref:Uncharacterized protein n=1 Tax=Paenibacillus graminis TaxID=189425 RepID=A0A089NI17_9BACL|nr:hypothetical protein [Paenibacillus graminis]AIQ68694.1 hypothetical protein PGRAT_14525 [Paenibacillus graminis]